MNPFASPLPYVEAGEGTVVYYSLIQYVPDLFRGERVNVGAVAVSPDGSAIRYMLAPEKKRLSCFSSQFKIEEVRAVESFLGSLADHRGESPLKYAVPSGDGAPAPAGVLAALRDQFALSTIQFDEVRWAEFEDTHVRPDQIDVFLGDLIGRLVRTPKPTRKKADTLDLKATFRQDMRARHLLGRRVDEHKLVENYTPPSANWKVDYGIQNQKHRLFEMIDFEKYQSPESADVQKESSYSYVKFRRAADLLGKENIANYTVYTASPDTAADVQSQLELLEEQSTLFNYADEGERARLQELVMSIVKGK